MTLTNDEYDSIMEASPAIGEHLESMGKTDMADMSEEQWLDFIAFAYAEICKHNQIKWTGPDGAPF